MSVAAQLEALIVDINTAKQAILSKGGSNTNKFSSSLAGDILALSSGSGGDIPFPINMIELPEILKNTTLYSTRTRAGNWWLSGDAIGCGLWFWDVAAGTVEQIFAQGERFQWVFETSAGITYFSRNNPSSATNGIYSIVEGVVTRIHNADYWQYWKETKVGLVYAGGGASSTGLRRIFPTYTETTGITGANWSILDDDSEGNLYASSSTSGSTRLYKIPAVGGNGVQLIASGFGWQLMGEDDFGVAYFAAPGTGGAGIYSHVKGTNVATQILNVGNSWSSGSFFKSPFNGKVYAGGSSTAAATTYGIFVLSATGVSRILDVGYRWDGWVEDANGYKYARSSAGVVMITPDDIATLIYSSAGNFNNLKISEDGMLFLSGSAAAAPGIFVVQSGSLKKIFNTGYGYTFTQDGNNMICKNNEMTVVIDLTTLLITEMRRRTITVTIAEQTAVGASGEHLVSY